MNQHLARMITASQDVDRHRKAAERAAKAAAKALSGALVEAVRPTEPMLAGLAECVEGYSKVWAGIIDVVHGLAAAAPDITAAMKRASDARGALPIAELTSEAANGDDTSADGDGDAEGGDDNEDEAADAGQAAQ